jgi:hypothetical protein
MEVAVKNNSKRLVGLDGVKGQITLLPGINKISKADCDHVMKHPIVKDKVESGDLEFLLPEGEEGATPVSALLKLSVKDAKETIKGSADVNILTEWFAAEKRKEVKAALEKQIEELNAEPEHRDDN